MKWTTGLVLYALFVCACAGRDKKGNRIDTPTSGHIKIAVDESLQPLLDAEAYAFEGIYKNAHVDLSYTAEEQAVDLLMKDSVRLIVITRPLSEEEVAKLEAQQIKAHEITIATDGIALIVHRDNADSLLTIDNLKGILSGKISRWDALHSKAKTDSINVVFDQPNSGIIRHLKDSLNLQAPLPGNCFAVKGNPAVVEYVSSHANALGLIDVSWISDRDDSTAHGFLKTIRVVGVKNDSGYYQPYQAYMAEKRYPLLRKIIMISREARAGLASGFTAFAASDKGQRIVLKAGLVPATMPVRIVQINNQPLE